MGSLSRWYKRTKTGGTVPPVVVFPHIPKTAGQTVLEALKQLVPEEAFSPVRTHANAAPDAQMPSGYRLYAGHIDWVDLDTLPEDRFAFTVLRDPRERIASFYFYLIREAAKLSAEELTSKARTNMRTVTSVSADDYFFGGDRAWQRFVHDHYNNFYCNYLTTRKIRGWTEVADLDQPELVRRALDGAGALQRIYTVDGLDALKVELAEMFGTCPEIQGTYVNAGPNAGRTARWPALLERFERDDSAGRLERFVEADVKLMQGLGFET
ncbi:sulfotransferase family 2 domain-containing protein [uncultured Tateyamaria sp.]|uniref:sulfotransferase family 2 domain-containing protein n=1 Tax=uncultured Tateyamaria sp. TaxID=455651 RepID=UPI0026386B7E|nr:sulfotransferase family 2 domain-containing protein [uncultured Tateyamaria sp.]